jgi:hypothetical protein
MTRKEFRGRLAVLEEHRRHQQPATEVLYHIHFVDVGRRFDPTIAEGPAGFICRRHADETVEDFLDRADIEVLALKPRVPIAGLVFRREEA